jgi:hypothetical protein
MSYLCCYLLIGIATTLPLSHIIQMLNSALVRRQDLWENRILVESKLPHLATNFDGNFMPRYQIWEWMALAEARWLWGPSRFDFTW